MRIARALSGGVVIATTVASCDPIEGRSPTNAPVNSCAEFPCERYDLGKAKAQPRCSIADRCEFPGQRPDTKAFLVIHVPDTSSYGPGYTFVLSNDELDKRPARATCPQTALSPFCVSLPELATTEGGYRVLREAAAEVDFPLALGAETSIPVRVVYRPIQTPAELAVGDIPLDVFSIHLKGRHSAKCFLNVYFGSTSQEEIDFLASHL